MAGRLTLWGAGELLRTFFSRTSEPPASFFLALIKESTPTPYMSGDELDEPEGESYARVEIPNDYENWSSDSEQLHIIGNTAEVAFVTAQEDWGRIGYWALCNAETGGFCYFVGDMETTQFVNTGDQAVVSAGDLVVELGPFFTDEEF